MEESRWLDYAPSYMTALQTAAQYIDEPRDLLGNVRVPDLESLVQGAGNTTDRFQWQFVDRSQKTNYTSLYGVPLVDIPRLGNMSFPLESAYWTAQCNDLAISGNSTIGTDKSSSYETGSSSFELDIDYRNDFWRHADEIMKGNYYTQLTYFTKAGNVSYNKYDNYTTRWYEMSTNCTISLRVVESDVACTAGLCNVQRMRYSNRSLAKFFADPDLEDGRPGATPSYDRLLGSLV